MQHKVEMLLLRYGGNVEAWIRRRVRAAPDKDDFKPEEVAHLLYLFTLVNPFGVIHKEALRANKYF